MERFLEIMGPAGTLPESLNGRLAMLGFVAALAQEKLHPGLTVADQLAQPGVVGVVLGLVALTQLASVAPLAQGAEPRDAKVGPFRAEAELLNGRLAMLALAGGSAWEVQSGAPLARSAGEPVAPPGSLRAPRARRPWHWPVSPRHKLARPGPAPRAGHRGAEGGGGARCLVTAPDWCCLDSLYILSFF